MLFCFVGASAPSPDLSFASLVFIYFGVGDFRFAPIVLTQKVSKKVKRPHPAFGHPLPKERDKRKKVFGRFTRKTYAQLTDPSVDGPNSLLRRSNRTVSNANFTCFSVHRTRSLVGKLPAIQYLLSFY